jgi:hypothetical protein
MSFGKTGCLAEENTLWCLVRPMPAWKIEPIFGGKLFRGERRLAQIGAASRTDPRKTAIGDREGSRSASLWPRALENLHLAPAIIRNALKLTGLYWRARRNADSHLTTEPNAVVEPIHPKAMPVILTTDEERDVWVRGE